MANNNLVEHYDNVSEIYDSLPFYVKSDYTDFLLSIIKPLTSEKIVLDIGCGTCQFSELLNAKKLICVDPSEKMLFKRPLLKNQEKYVSDGINFLEKNRVQYDVILLKESLHHFSDKNKLTLLKHCHECADTTVMAFRPNDNQYPWFRKAQDIYEKQSVHLQSVINMLQELNFSFIQKELIVPIQMSLKQWQQMLLSRFWSNLYSLSDLELQNEVNSLKDRYADEVIFQDKVILLIAKNVF